MPDPLWKLNIGALTHDGNTRFNVWAPKAGSLAVRLTSGKRPRTVLLREEESGWFTVSIEDVGAGDRYFYVLEEQTERPDPASRFQPEGVHRASQVVDPRLFPWTDTGWSGVALEEYVIYELHVGTFSREGTFAAVIPFLQYLLDLGITAVEIMPVAQFPGSRNWGYDGVYPFAPQNSYGGPDGLKQLVDACHSKGLAVILDVVYNHFGPEGNYLNDFGYYFTDRYRTPWGDAINFDGPYSDPVRDFFIQNALYWLDEFHIDSLRLDAIDTIYDFSARHFLQQLTEEVHNHRAQLGRKSYLIAESDLFDARLINPSVVGGYGVDAQWNDSFHHALHTLLTGEKAGYYVDYGRFSQIVKAFSESFVYTGEYSAYRKKRHGSPVKDAPPSQFVVFSQNHDQVGNRMLGDRLSMTQPIEKLLLAAGVVILSPYLPLLFMGEEYGEKAPFHYFVNYSDAPLIEAVRKGRQEEFAAFAWEGEAPDPQDESPFLRSKLDLNLKREGEQALIYKFYRQLLALRRNIPPFRNLARESIQVTGFDENKVVALRRHSEKNVVICLFSFSDREEEVTLSFAGGEWECILDSSETEWGGRGAVTAKAITASTTSLQVRLNPFSLVIYYRG